MEIFLSLASESPVEIALNWDEYHIQTASDLLLNLIFAY